MKFSSPLLAATLIKRYKRFLADVRHAQLGEFTVHCPNTGSMKNCWSEGDRVYLLDSQNPKRKYQYTWISSHIKATDSQDQHWLCLNTHLANPIVVEGINNGVIEELQSYSSIQQEIKYGEENSRIDLLLTANNKPDCYVEIKTVTLLEATVDGKALDQGHGFFPDAVSTRGQKHLRELTTLAQAGHRAVLLFLVQHSGIKSVSPAAHIDPQYAQLLGQALDAGVEILCYRTHISPAEIILQDSLPFIFK
ncbi:DNA/RNA nuclease SfsA [Kangiella sp. TOML190]|uniref:DNA/RNA nuclease SfsA n=1 Tax=Kangiella sp. TOML190 TaxID=2931351 RepID=UPI00203F638A|nr:DNA/RNA nuclease SfsA [Kangiella sp. TOML190]